jgi:hypothetical protein
MAQGYPSQNQPNGRSQVGAGAEMQGIAAGTYVDLGGSRYRTYRSDGVANSNRGAFEAVLAPR